MSLQSEKIWFVNLITIIFFLCSCSSNGSDPASIASSIDVKYPVSEEFLIDSQIEVFLINESAFCVAFPLDDGLKIYAQENDEEVEVENLIINIGSQDLILYPKGKMLSTRSLDLRPDTNHLKMEKPTKFKVILTGYLCEDENVQIQKEFLLTSMP